jgi:VWFA-related protein
VIRSGACALAALSAAAIAAQPIRPEASVIRASSRLVQVNVIVRDKSGPVTTLTKDDFVLADRGKPQVIQEFSVETPGDAAPDQMLPANTFSNHPARVPANTTVVLLDGLNTRFENQAHAKRELMKFLAAVDPTGRIALYTLGKTLRVLCDFDRPDQLQRILAPYKGIAATDFATAEPDHSNTGSDILDPFIDAANQAFVTATSVDRAGITVQAFRAIANHLARVPGRKNLVWVTGSTPFSVAGAARALNGADIAVYPVDARGLVGLPPELTAVASGGRTRSAVSFRPGGLDTMEELADQTGGRAFFDTNDLSQAIRSAVDDSEVTYSLGFYPDDASLDGKFHELKVRVDRAGVQLRYRKGYVASAEAASSAQEARSSLLAAISSPLESAAIPLTATVELVKGNSIKIHWTTDISHLQMAAQGPFRVAEITLLLVQQDAAGKLLDSSKGVFKIRLTGEAYESDLKSGAKFNSYVQPKDGLASLRMVVVDRSNAVAGSLLIPLSRVK